MFKIDPCFPMISCNGEVTLEVRASFSTPSWMGFLIIGKYRAWSSQYFQIDSATDGPGFTCIPVTIANIGTTHHWDCYKSNYPLLIKHGNGNSHGNSPFWREDNGGVDRKIMYINYKCCQVSLPEGNRLSSKYPYERVMICKRSNSHFGNTPSKEACHDMSCVGNATISDIYNIT